MPYYEPTTFYTPGDCSCFRQFLRAYCVWLAVFGSAVVVFFIVVLAMGLEKNVARLF